MNTIQRRTSSLVATLEEQLQPVDQEKPNVAERVKSQARQALWPATGLLQKPGELPYQPFIATMKSGAIIATETSGNSSQALVTNTSIRAGFPIGTSTPAPAAGGTTTLPDVGNMPYFIQQGNACG